MDNPIDILNSSTSYNQPISKGFRLPASDHKTSYLIRLGVVTYVFALSLIAAFSIAFHFITDSIVHRQQTTARVVNLSGRQRMLSQRIAKLCLERAAHVNLRPDAETLGALRFSIRLMETSEAELVNGSRATGGSVLETPAVAKVYREAPWHLDAQLADFLQHAHALADKPEGALSAQDSDLRALEADARTPLLDALNAVVDTIQADSEASIQHLRRVLACLTLLMLVILALEALLLYRPLFLQLEKANKELILTGRTDTLTGCLNRGGFADEAHQAVAQARSEGSLVSVLMIDIDRFKRINDTYGHAVGDLVINSMARVLAQRTRRNNVLSRMGGEEFSIILHQCTLQAAMLAAENLRAAVEANPVRSGGDKTLNVTISVGVATLRFEDVTLFYTLNRADKALYQAKLKGRNRVERECEEADNETAATDAVYALHSRV